MKKIVIDGHNLIPKIEGISLKDLDDEERLIEVIQEYCRLARRQAELFFDGSPEPNQKPIKSGLVHVHFVKIGHSADAAIIEWLRSNGKNACNMVTISSDRRVQADARGLGAEVISSEEFAREVKQVLSSPARTREMREKLLSADEVEEWLNLFHQKKNS